MPSLLTTDIAANYRQQQVPYSRFGTRKVVWYKIGHENTSGGENYIDMPKMNAIIDAIQTQMEIVMVGAPLIRENYAKFMVAVFEDTANDGEYTDPAGYYQDNQSAQTLQQTLRNLPFGTSATVEKFYLAGAPNDHYDGYDNGFSTDNTYQEYATKSEFENNSYTHPLGL
jgi:hypothetical protein